MASGQDVRQAFPVVELGSDSRRNTALRWGSLLMNKQVGASQNEELVALRRVTRILCYLKISL